MTFMNFGGAKRLIIKSDPPGLVASSTTCPETNSSYTSINLSGSSNGYVFSHWEVNGVRQSDPKGVGLSRVNEILNQDKTLLAKYYPENEDSDNDGIPDWYEWREFGTLSHSENSDPDGDGISIARERQFGLSGVIDDNISEGGVSIRRSSLTFMNFGGAKKVTVKSNPPGLINSTTSYPETNSTFTSSNLNGTNNGYVFSHWEVNGVLQQADDKGIGLGRVIEILNEDKNLLAKYYPANEDTDSDGIQDWYEWREFGTLIYDGKSDPDGDGFTIARERQFGLSAVIDDNISEGGASIRRSFKFSYTDATFDNDSSLDSDNDGLTNAQEASLGLDPNNADTDGDGYPDGLEVAWGSNANDPNSSPIIHQQTLAFQITHCMRINRWAPKSGSLTRPTKMPTVLLHTNLWMGTDPGATLSLLSIPTAPLPRQWSLITKTMNPIIAFACG